MNENCTRCGLHRYRRHIVPGRGSPDKAKIVFIGEAPGTAEDMLEMAFVGPSGQLLNAMATKAGISIDECYFTNIVWCRPCDEKGGSSREPKPVEIAACYYNLIEVFSRIRYTGIVLVGKLAAKYYRSRFPAVPVVEITHPATVLKMGGKGCALFIDNAQKLKTFYNSLS